MPYFFDTSALFKRYQPERGTDLVCQILEQESQIFISSMSIIEVISNLKRLFEVDKITTQSQFQLQRSFFYQDIKKLNLTILDITSEDIISAEELIIKRYMKPVDSIQLAVALNTSIPDLIFVSADQRLNQIAKTERLFVLNPEE